MKVGERDVGFNNLSDDVCIFDHVKFIGKQSQAIAVTLCILQSNVVTDWSGCIMGDKITRGSCWSTCILMDVTMMVLVLIKTQWSSITENGIASGLLVHWASGSRSVDWNLLLGLYFLYSSVNFVDFDNEFPLVMALLTCGC